MQTIQAGLGAALLLLVSLAVVLAVIILLLLEANWILALAAKLVGRMTGRFQQAEQVLGGSGEDRSED
jgi:hypothetical protein